MLQHLTLGPRGLLFCWWYVMPGTGRKWVTITVPSCSTFPWRPWPWVLRGVTIYYACIYLHTSKHQKRGSWDKTYKKWEDQFTLRWWERRIAFLLTVMQSSVPPSTACQTGQMHSQTRTVQLCRRFAQKFIALVGSLIAATQGVGWFQKWWYVRTLHAWRMKLHLAAHTSSKATSSTRSTCSSCKKSAEAGQNQHAVADKIPIHHRCIRP